MIENYFSQGLITMNLTAFDIFVRLLTAFVLSGFIALVYQISRKGNVRKELIDVIVLASVGVCITLIAIGNSVPTAFGLFAALSLIRFRTPVKEAEDLVLIFLAVGLGIASGVGAFKVGYVSAVFVGTLFFLRSLFHNAGSDYGEYYLRIQEVGSLTETTQSAVKQLLKPYNSKVVEWNKGPDQGSMVVHRLSGLSSAEAQKLVVSLKGFADLEASLVYSGSVGAARG